MSDDALGKRLLTFSPLESARFGLRIFRGVFDAPDARVVADLVAREDVDIAILRVPAHKVGMAAELASAGLPAFVADTLVHYGADIGTLALAAPRDPSLRMRSALPSDIESVARQVFTGYVSHYNANPYLETKRIPDGYAEWAAHHAVANDEGRAAYLMEAGMNVVGFSCTQTLLNIGEMRGILNGVLPQSRGRGLYRDMLRLLLQRCKSEGLARFAIATQSHNTSVQRVWTSEGLLLEREEATIHVNAFLTTRHTTRA